MSFELKPVADKTLLYVMAADAEYGRHLHARFLPLMTGVGPVEAAVVLTRTLAELKGQGALPDLVVSLGSAGSARLEQAEVYQATSVAYRDMDASPLGFEKGITPFLDLPVVVDLPLRFRACRRRAFRPGPMWSPARSMTRSPPTWWRWRPLRCSGPASPSASR